MIRTCPPLTAALTTLVLALQAGCEHRGPSAQSSGRTIDQATTVEDLEAQLTRQVREQWPSEQLSSVHITEFREPHLTAAVAIGVDIEWVTRPGDTHMRSMSTGMHLYSAASNYLVGTLQPADHPRVNVILKFR